MMYGRENANKVYGIPVEWVVTEMLEIKADSLEEAVKFIVNNESKIPCGDNAEYIDGTYKISADDNCNGDVAEIVENLKDRYYSEREATPYDTLDKKIGGAA